MTQYQPSLPPMLLNSVDEPSACEVHEVDLSLESARQSVGRIVAATIGRRALKEFGDKGQVHRWCIGEGNPNIALFFKVPSLRRAFLIAWAEESGDADISTEIRIRRRA